MTTTAATRAPRRRVAKGPKRPQYLAHAELDKFMMMFTALMAEVSALRDRLDTHEALGDAQTPVSRESVERYALSEDEREQREAGRDAMLKRVFRILLEDLETAQASLSSRDLVEVLEDDGALAESKG
jgi:hypothetical protein